MDPDTQSLDIISNLKEITDLFLCANEGLSLILTSKLDKLSCPKRKWYISIFAQPRRLASGMSSDPVEESVVLIFPIASVRFLVKSGLMCRSDDRDR